MGKENVHDLLIYFKKLEQEILNQKKVKKQKKFFDDISFDLDYFEKLANYNQGLIQFGKPKPYGAEITNHNFALLFEKFVGDHLKENARSDDKHKEFREYIRRRIEGLNEKKKADINFKFLASSLRVVSDTTVDFICKNGHLIVGKCIDFTQSAQTVELHINQYYMLANALSKFSSKHKLETGGEYLLFFEHPINGTAQEKILDNARKNDLVTVKDKEEIGPMAKALEKQPVAPFTEYIKQLPKKEAAEFCLS
jgi:hypothetical protein